MLPRMLQDRENLVRPRETIELGVKEKVPGMTPSTLPKALNVREPPTILRLPVPQDLLQESPPLLGLVCGMPLVVEVVGTTSLQELPSVDAL
jgi:hypothetical protein